MDTTVSSQAAAESNTESPIWHHSWGDLPGGKWIKMNSVHQGRGRILSLLELDSYSRYEFTFPAFNDSAKQSWYSIQHYF